jgi:DNA-binding response OmpR family regulator
MRILIVEDDKVIGDGLVQGLLMDNYAVDWVKTKNIADTALRTTTYDLMILDIGLPDGSGLDVLKKLRQEKNNMPVMILTAYDETSQKVKGLDTGADDYLIKPFDLDELRARIRALQRRSTGRGTPLFKSADIVLDPATHQVTLADTPVKLGSKEFAILQALMENPGRILSKVQLEEKLYGWDMENGSNTIEVHIHGLRRKLGKNAVITVRHVGYKITKK